MKKILIAIIAILCLALFSGCGKSPIGEWELTGVVSENGEISDITKALDGNLEGKLTLGESGKYDLNIWYGEYMSFSGNYEIQDNEIMLEDKILLTGEKIKAPKLFYQGKYDYIRIVFSNKVDNGTGLVFTRIENSQK